MNRQSIILVWLGGLVLALLLTVLGPAAVFGALGHAAASVQALLSRLGMPTRQALRGFAIAAYVVFIVLCVLARRAGLPAMGLAVTVTALFVLLVGGPSHWQAPLDVLSRDGWYRGDWNRGNWGWALIVAGGGAAVMTRRLMRGGRPTRPGLRSGAGPGPGRR